MPKLTMKDVDERIHKILNPTKPASRDILKGMLERIKTPIIKPKKV